ncbi:681_t:CDS:2 [Funneliformis mosseae]|uniref:681_t:CDS:1 n=1 Tax=Funneliformis mosseae TaxID=27381 RepID=A0A9N9FJ27_FUNMO|nr:681_t:CDS:2 [Funneliformis mosseae]
MTPISSKEHDPDPDFETQWSIMLVVSQRYPIFDINLKHYFGSWTTTCTIHVPADAEDWNGYFFHLGKRILKGMMNSDPQKLHP